jgi:hypothetical protein
MNNNLGRTTGFLVACLVGLVGTAGAGQRIDLPVSVGVVNYDQHGFINIAGEVRNTSSIWVCAPRIEVALRDASGKPLGVQSVFTEAKKDAGLDGGDGVYAERVFVPPGEVAVFHYLRDQTKVKGAPPASHLIKASAGECPAARTAMQVMEVKADRNADGFYRVRGMLKNVGTGPCRSPRAVIGLYRADGKIVIAREETPDAMFQKVLRPGQSVAFEFRTLDDAKLVAKSQAWGDCNWPE